MPSAPAVKVIVYDAPTVGSSSCACGCGHHDHHHESVDPLETVNLEFQTQALAMTLEAAFPGKVKVEYINVLQDPRGPASAPDRIAGLPGLSHAPGVHQWAGTLCRGPAGGADPGRGGEDPGR